MTATFIRRFGPFRKGRSFFMQTRCGINCLVSFFLNIPVALFGPSPISSMAFECKSVESTIVAVLNRPYSGCQHESIYRFVQK